MAPTTIIGNGLRRGPSPRQPRRCDRDRRRWRWCRASPRSWAELMGVVAGKRPARRRPPSESASAVRDTSRRSGAGAIDRGVAPTPSGRVGIEIARSVDDLENPDTSHVGVVDLVGLLRIGRRSRRGQPRVTCAPTVDHRVVHRWRRISSSASGTEDPVADLFDARSSMHRPRSWEPRLRPRRQCRRVRRRSCRRHHRARGGVLHRQDGRVERPVVGSGVDSGRQCSRETAMPAEDQQCAIGIAQPACCPSAMSHLVIGASGRLALRRGQSGATLVSGTQLPWKPNGTRCGDCDGCHLGARDVLGIEDVQFARVGPAASGTRP